MHIAGVHSPGSLGVVHHLVHHLPSLFRAVGDRSFSMAIRCELDGPKVTDTVVVSGPHAWP